MTDGEEHETHPLRCRLGVHSWQFETEPVGMVHRVEATCERCDRSEVFVE